MNLLRTGVANMMITKAQPNNMKTRWTKCRPHILPLLLLFVATFSVYGRIIGYDFIMNWDDNYYVTQNAAVWGGSWANIRTVFSSYYCGNYAPVQMLTYMADYSVWGLWPGGFHLTNLLLHFLNGLLFYILLLKFHRERLLATVGAAIFLLHPVQVESVVWISQRKNLLAMLFFLFAWQAYCRYREAAQGSGRFIYFLSLVAFVLSLLAKSAAVIFPAVILLYDFCFLSSERRVRLLDKVPYIAAAGAVAYLAMQSQLPEGNGWGGYGGGRADFHGGSPLATFFTMVPVFCCYLRMLVWPTGLSAAYAPTIHQSLNLIVAGTTLLLAFVGLLCVRLFRADRTLGFWAVYFFLAFLPVSQIVPLVTLMNDRYFYFPMLGAAALGGAGAVLIHRKTDRRYRLFVTVIFYSLLVTMSILSYQRTTVWRNARTLWGDVVNKHPELPSPWEALGEAYHSSRPVMLEDALRAYQRAIKLDPASELTLFNMSLLYTEMGKHELAYETLRKLLDNNPDHVTGLAAMGDIYLQRGDYAKAEHAYRRAQALQPEAIQVVQLLANLAVVRGRFAQAESYYRQMEEKRPGDPETAFRLASVEASLNRKDEALTWLEKALQRGYRDYFKLHDSVELSPLWREPQYNYLMLKYFPDLEVER